MKNILAAIRREWKGVPETRRPRANAVASIRNPMEEAFRALFELAALDKEIRDRRSEMASSVARVEASRMRVAILEDRFAALQQAPAAVTPEHPAAVPVGADPTQEALRQVEADLRTHRAIVRLEATRARALEASGQDEVQASEGSRARLRKQVPPGLLLLYDRLDELGRRPPIAAARGGACSECHIAFPLQIQNELLSGKSLQLCPYCRRMLWSASPKPAPQGQKPSRKGFTP